MQKRQVAIAAPTEVDDDLRGFEPWREELLTAEDAEDAEGTGLGRTKSPLPAVGEGQGEGGGSRGACAELPPSLATTAVG